MCLPTAVSRVPLRHIAGVALLAAAIVLGACGGEETSEDSGRAPAALADAPDSMTVDRVLRTDRRFSTLVAALDSTGLDSTLASAGPFTVFAPPDTAFAALPEGTMPILLADRRDRLRRVLAHHVVEGRVGRDVLSDPSALPTLSGDTLRVRAADSAQVVGRARVLDGDVEVANGLIHVIDAVLRPSSSESE